MVKHRPYVQRKFSVNNEGSALFAIELCLRSRSALEPQRRAQAILEIEEDKNAGIFIAFRMGLYVVVDLLTRDRICLPERRVKHGAARALILSPRNAICSKAREKRSAGSRC